MALFQLEVLDRFNAGLSYDFVDRYLVTARSFRGAISKVSRYAELGRIRKTLDTGNMAQWSMDRDCLVVTGNVSDDAHAKFMRGRYPDLIEL